jgi:hypothetical protein
MRLKTMRISMKQAVLSAALLGVAAFVVIDTRDEKPVASAAPAARVSAATPAAQKRAEPQTAPQSAALPARGALGEPESPLFAVQSWQPPPPKAVAPPPPPPPTAPPMPFRFAGRIVQDGRLSVFLAKGDTLLTVRQGDTVDGVYRVDSVGDTEIALTYVPLGQKQTIPVVSSLPRGLAGTALAGAPPAPAQARAGAPAAPVANAPASAPPAAAPAAGAPAQLQWGGPDKVKLGTRFDVTLRVKSDELLHAWPMQLRYDPALFEVVTVKPGASISDPTFGYRVNPDGSILIGASAQSGARASNAELLVLTLLPMKPAAAAELNVTSLTLQGAAGRPIAYDRIAAFRTAITP